MENRELCASLNMDLEKQWQKNWINETSRTLNWRAAFPKKIKVN